MLAPDSQPAAPPRKTRLAWWLGIYLTAANGFWIFLVGGKNFGGSLLHVLLAPIVWGVTFPFGLIGLCDFLPKSFISSDQSGGRVTAVFTVLLPLAYAMYITHLVYTLKAKTLSNFRLLLLALVVIVSVNLVGCYAILTKEDKPAVFQPKQAQK